MMNSRLPKPVECGLPPKFTAWRPRQDEAIERTAMSEKRFVVLCMPTGSGKSLTYMAVAKLTGFRTCVLTSTKGLQTQLYQDFNPMGLVDIRGMANYPCRHLNEEEEREPTFTGMEKDKVQMCDVGPCSAGFECDYREAGCDYYDSVGLARKSNYVVTNYAYWFHARGKKDREGKERPPVGKFDILVLDEAHNAPEELGSYLSVEITHNQTDKLDIDWPLESDDWDWWRKWAATVAARAAKEVAMLTDLVKRGRADRKQLRWYKECRRLTDNMARVALSQGEWVVHMARRGDRGVLTLNFDPVWPGEYAEAEMFRGVKKIILTSATVRPKTLELLGVPSNEIDFIEYPSTFPVDRRPVMWSPTMRMDKRADADSIRHLWIPKIDRIIGGRMDRKGLIHTVSYARRDFIMRYSEHSSLMMTHETANARQVTENFKKSNAPSVLVSPSMSTGVDFPYDECRYIIIGKVPFPDSRDKIIKARTQLDPEYSYYLAMLVLQQAAGRGMRAADDLCEVFVIDDHISWFMGKWGRTLAANWFLQSFKKVNYLPEAPHL